MKREKQDILSFVRSIIDNSSIDIDVNNKFLDLLIETSMAAAFYDKHENKINEEYKNTFKNIYDGIKAQNEYHNITIEFLKNSHIEYYLLKDRAEPYKNRYTSDVDVLVDKENITELHQYLNKNGFLLQGEDIFYNINLRKKLAELNVDQSKILELEKQMIKIYEDFYHAKLNKNKNSNKTKEKINIVRYLQELRNAEINFLSTKTTLPFLKYVYNLLDKKRAIQNKSKLLKLNSRIHLIFRINKFIFAGTGDAYTKYNNFFFGLLNKFESYIPPKKNRENILNKINLNYHRGIEFLDIKTSIPALGLAEKKDILVYNNKIAPVDNLILNASHFRGNIKRSKNDSYQGFIKYLLDGAILLKRNNIDCELLKKRAKKFKKTSQLKYYLYLLNKTGLINYKCKLPSGFWFLILKNIPEYKLLFNENSFYILIVKRLIKIQNLKYRFLNKTA